MRWTGWIEHLQYGVWTVDAVGVYSAVKLLRRVQGGCVSEEDTEGCCWFWRRAVAPQSPSCNSFWKSVRSGEENPQRLLRCTTNYKPVESLSCRVGLFSCAAVMKPLYKQEMYILKVNSTRNFNSQIPFPLQFCVVWYLQVLALVPPAFVWNCRRKPSNICLPSHSVITEIRPPILPTIGCCQLLYHT